ncbi:MAG: adenosylmethionine--8-amino-7-oxononanoate transaminase [gamma proteobacterium symbiont of Bathyaustriella thionipta]|nr:adenosylmethionine--8-amino-7-oxononanoate transaminase [gamma proteobacterium symbiont of Bathyaustriella thionipta]
MSLSNKELIERDLRTLWHPCTQMKDHEWLPLVPIKSGKGVWLQDFDGNRYIDAISSWWVNLFGHANPRINQAVKHQLDELEHVLLAGFSHQPAIELAERLIQLAPAGLTRCFYVDNGSSAVEAALKMSFHYWLNCGKPQKTRFVTLQNSYHGETLGALAVGDVALYKETYKPLLMEAITAPSPDCYYRESGESWHDYSLRQFDSMAELLRKQADSVCAVIVEPLVQCAGGMRMYHPVYLSRLRSLCDELDVHLIADEIAVGFGRTGTLFACEQADITPDLMCLSKGLTGGYLPLSLVLAPDKIYQAFYDDYSKLNAFLQSHSYTGNPLGCSAALATLDIFQQDQVIQKNQHLSKKLRDATVHLNDHPHVAEVRQQGMIVAVEMVKNKSARTAYAWQERRGLTVYQHALKNQALLRPLGNVCYLMPPYVINEEEIDHLARVLTEGIDLATKE